MLARERLRDEETRVREALEARGADLGSYERWRSLDAERRAVLVEVEELKHRRNEASREIGAAKGRGEEVGERIAEVGRWKERIAGLEERGAGLDTELGDVELRLPNLPHATVPRGADQAANRVERVVGEPPAFDFPPRPHWEIGSTLGILDFERGAKVAGARFTTYFGWGARLERALAAFMLDLHTGEHGYTEVLPPYLVNAQTMTGTGQLPKFEADLFQVTAGGLYLIPTAEVPVTNLHRGEVLDEASLPRRYTAWTPCFRAEAGSYGKDVRGLIRQHQFHKVELVQLTAPQSSYGALEELTGHAERVLERLELPYRVVSLSTGDLGFASAKTYDLEVWLPGQGAYREISSCSNCEDFQARRAGLRYRPAGGGKPQWLHTLNGSGLAVGRTLVAILENGQRSDGSVVLPPALRPYVGGVERLEAPAG